MSNSDPPLPEPWLTIVKTITCIAAYGLMAYMLVTFMICEFRCPYCRSWFRHHETDTMSRCRKCKSPF